MHNNNVWRHVGSHVRLRIPPLGLLLALLAALGVNAQQVYPNCVTGQSCARQFVFPWIPVGSHFTARVAFLDNLPNDQSGATPAVEWWLTWYNMTPSGVVQWQSSLSVSENGATASSQGIVFLGQCATNGCTDTLDLLAPICSGQGGSNPGCTPGSISPVEMDLAGAGMAQVVASPNDQFGNPVPNGILSLTPPSVHVMYWNGLTNTVSWDDTYPAVWYDQAYPSWHAPVVVGGGAQQGWFKDCAFAVVNMDPTGAGTTITVSLEDVSGNVIDQETIPIMSQQYQNTAYECSAFFPNEAKLPQDKGTNANLVFRASQPIIPFVNQVLGGGGLGGNIASVTVFQDVTQPGTTLPLPQPPPTQ